MTDEDESQPSIVVPYRPLPREVLTAIFRRTAPPDFLLDSSLTVGPNSPWSKAQAIKQVIPLVCKEWYAAGIELLYESIVLHRYRQLPLLRETFEKPPGTLPEYTKEVTLYINVHSRHASSFERYMQRVVDLCPRMERFNFKSPVPLARKLPYLSPSIRRLELGPSTRGQDFADALNMVGKNLTWLSIHIPEIAEYFNVSNTWDLPQLEDLFMETTASGVDNLMGMKEVVRVPRLQRITLKLKNAADTVGRVEMTGLSEFCRKHGGRVDFVHIQPEYSPTMSGYELKMEGVVDACPKLEHVVLHPRATKVSHSRVKWVDIWRPSSDDDQWKTLRASLDRSSFPRLVHVRELAIGLAQFEDIPKIMRPWLMKEMIEML